jgi:hypothetical protein
LDWFVINDLEIYTMQRLRPRIILEGTDYGNTKETALLLSKHPRLVGEMGHESYTAVISAKWQKYVGFTWGKNLIAYDLDQEEHALNDYSTWMSLIEIQHHYGWIIDRFHISTRQYQIQHNQSDCNFDWLEKRLLQQNFHLVLVTQNRKVLSEKITQPDLLETTIQSQNILQELVAESKLPTLELDISEKGLQETVEIISVWADEMGANLLPENESPGRVIVPAVC